MSRPDAQAASEIKKELHQYTLKHYVDIFNSVYGDDPDLLTQALVTSVLFDVTSMLGLDPIKFDRDKMRTAGILVASYMRYYAEYKNVTEGK